MPRPIYDWPVHPQGITIYAPTSLEEAKLSYSGYTNENKIQGARNIVKIQLPQVFDENIRLYNWLLSHAGSYFRVPAYNTPMLVDYKNRSNGIPFAGDVSFSDGTLFADSKTMDVASTPLSGTNIIKIDTSRYPKKLKYGHMFGIGFGVYHVRDVEYSGNIATVQCIPPFRRDVVADDIVNLRPKVLCKVTDMSELANPIEENHRLQGGSIMLEEVIDNDFL